MGTLWNNAISDGYKVTGAEVLQAAPYFISPKAITNPALVWNWSINNNVIALTNPLEPNLLPIQAQSGVSGNSTIDLTISNTYKIFENISKEINVSF